MAKFDPAFDKAVLAEGGYKLTNIPADKGGMTYCGIARNRWSSWSGWAFVDRGEIPPTQMVREFYQSKFWDVVKGDYILHQKTADSLFDFGVNAGPTTAIKLAQIVAGVAPDGAVGPKTLQALNVIDEETFQTKFALAKIARYRDIVMKDRTQHVFFLGWVNRALKVMA